MKRREFLKVVGGAAGATALSGYLSPIAIAETVAGMPRRVLGRTGRNVSIICFPGLALTHDSYDQARCTKALHDALENGVNYFDVAPAYGNGKCETRMGIGLEGVDRGKYFLACKTKMRDKDGARKELETSLKLLKTDHFDLYQMHHVRSRAEAQQALGPGGALETFLKAKEEGKIKHIGFSAHTNYGALELLKGFKFDTVMFPINFVELYKIQFGEEVMKVANEQGAALISIKPMSHGGWPKGMQQTRKWWYRCTETDEEVARALRWTLSLKGVVSGVPPSWLDLVEKAIAAAKTYKPATDADVAELKKLAESGLSIFEREEKQFAMGGMSPHDLVYPDSPHEYGHGHGHYA
jgi:predicted aldo/keto reductase-like oxidoreductase